MAIRRRGDFVILTANTPAGGSVDKWVIRPNDNPLLGATHTVSIELLSTTTATVTARHANDGVNYQDIADITGKTADFTTNVVYAGGAIDFVVTGIGGAAQVKVGVT